MPELVVSQARRGASIPELSRQYGVSETLLYALANDGKLPGARRIGKRIVIHVETFEEWIKEGMGA